MSETNDRNFLILANPTAVQDSASAKSWERQRRTRFTARKSGGGRPAVQDSASAKSWVGFPNNPQNL